MATWKVRITGKQRSAPDVDLLLAAVMALGRQLRDEGRRQSARRAKQPQPVSMPDAASESIPDAVPVTPGQEVS